MWSVLLLMVNGVLGGALWFGFLTDYEWDSTAANVVFPMVVGGIAWGSLGVLRRRERTGRWGRGWAWACCLPGMVGGLAFLLAIVLFCAPILPALFWIDEQADAVTIERERSPGGGTTARVVFIPVGAYSGGNGRIRVYLSYDWLPMVRRQVYARRISVAEGKPTDNVSWQGPGTILLAEEDEPLRPGLIRWQTPFIVRVPSTVWRMFVSRPTGLEGV